uniref:Uncharacterized protein n=1 Tax=Oryza rufipogon TaxID=4529 RepID=A0A0E0Q403_ORYRU
MAMRTLVSKLRIPAAASRRTPPTFRSFCSASQELGSTAARATAKVVYPYVGHKAIFEPAIARQNRYRWWLTFLRLIRNYVALNAAFRASSHVQKPE